MYARVVMLTGVKDIDAAVTYVQDTALPILESQRGYQGVSAGADRSAGILALLSLWDTAANRDASNSALAKVRDEGVKLLAQNMTVESLEELAVQVSKAPTAGCPMIITRVSMDPSRVADNVEYFKREIMPQVTSAPGFRSLRNLLNTQTGQGIVSSVWDDEASRKAAWDATQARRADVAATRGVTFDETIFGEVVFAKLK
jgi:heme-degrading monooxygenase HmoA